MIVLARCALVAALLATGTSRATAPVLAPDAFDELAAANTTTTTADAPHTPRQVAHTLAAAGHVRLPYSSNDAPDTWDGLTSADADPSAPGGVLTIYGNASYPGGSCGAGGSCSAVVTGWNREHLWAKSYGIDDDAVCNLAYTDLHHLRPSEPEMNQSRGNDYFDWCRRRDCSPKPLSDGSGRANRTYGDIWEVWDGRRGDVARALLYMDVRYEGGRYGTGRCVEPDLRLTDDRSLITTRDYPTDVAFMGMLSTLVEWHIEDPPDELERRRNDVVDVAQGNRNPFIDRPELACAVFTVAACVRTGQVVWLPALGETLN